jgi:hypothetical protein
MRLPFLGMIVCAVVVIPAEAADWPQWRGPNRDGISTETGLLKTWPKEGPKLLWTYSDAGIGYSGPSVIGDRVYTMGCRGDTEYILAIENGKQVWEAKVGPRLDNGWGDGPRSNPTVDGDRIYALGGKGDLVCVATDGAEKWRRSMKDDFKGQMMSGWGYCESVLIDGDHLVCCPGGKDGTFAKLDKKDGKLVWRSKDLTDNASYSSILIDTVNGVKQYVNMTGKGVAGVAAEDGKLLWKSGAAANGTAIIPTPILYKNFVYVTSGYGAGCGLVEITSSNGKFDAKNAYTNKEMTNHHGGVVCIDKSVYGYSDSGGRWLCQDIETGKKVWDAKKLPKGSITCADGQLYCYDENTGTCVLVPVSTQQWTENGRFTIPEKTKQKRKSGKIWTHPVVANGKLYLRDQDLIFCFDISGK